ncbi:MAG TPA: ABC transporter substrate-binding protein [Chloroflexota bacterium]|nr:ABC transporter substrate-binding protein [Chloroflexota bacterium]
MAAKPAASADAKPAASAVASAAPKLAIKSAYTTTSATSAPFWMAKETGAFEAEGLDVTLTRATAGSPILAAIESGDVPVSSAGGQEVVDSEVKGSSLVIVGGFGDKLTTSIMTVPSITKPEDLKGKALGVTSFGVVSHLAGLLAIDKLGLTGQVTFVATGGLPETIAAIQSGKVQGGVLSPPQTFEAQKQGLHQLYDLSTGDARLATAIVSTSRRYAAEHPEVVEHFLRAIIRAVHRAYVDKPGTVAALAKYGGISDPDVASQTYDYFANGALWGKDGMPSMDALQQNLYFAAAENVEGAGAFKPQQLVDTSFVQKIQASGLVENLYGRPLPLTL